MLIIDRFEEKYAVCENEYREMINIHISELPLEVKEGDCIELVKGRYIINHKETERLQKDIEKFTESLWK
ncbi:MAG: DUF3006 domain-containing protein [Clostridium sp.]